MFGIKKYIDEYMNEKPVHVLDDCIDALDDYMLNSEDGETAPPPMFDTLTRKEEFDTWKSEWDLRTDKFFRDLYSHFNRVGIFYLGIGIIGVVSYFHFAAQ
ncbi:TPA: hypothetical protein QDB06_000761 [Burkholderia vietnamiensis]|nr:hypothetical protein [Burkholderia vietnamiensis]